MIMFAVNYVTWNWFVSADIGQCGQSNPRSPLSRGTISDWRPRTGLFQTSDWPAGRPVILSGCWSHGHSHAATSWSTVGSLICDWSVARSASFSELGSRWVGFHSQPNDWSTLPSVQLSLAERRAGLLCRSADGSDGIRAIDHVVGWRCGGESDEAAGRGAGWVCWAAQWKLR